MMAALADSEIVAADTVMSVDPSTGVRSSRTRMRSGIQSGGDLFEPETRLSRVEVFKLLQRPADAA